MDLHFSTTSPTESGDELPAAQDVVPFIRNSPILLIRASRAPLASKMLLRHGIPNLRCPSSHLPLSKSEARAHSRPRMPLLSLTLSKHPMRSSKSDGMLGFASIRT